jgi:hypothetical protein
MGLPGRNFYAHRIAILRRKSEGKKGMGALRRPFFHQIVILGAVYCTVRFGGAIEPPLLGLIVPWPVPLGFIEA